MIDLDALADAVGLPAEAAGVLAYGAAIALQRRHQPGARLAAIVQGRDVSRQLHWRERDRTASLYQDINRVTEEGAEAIALALTCSHGPWRVKRRLQSRLADGADWLLADQTTGSRMVLEVGGTDEQELVPLLARKLDQAKRSPFSARSTPAACVVRFLEPSAILWSDDGPR